MTRASREGIILSGGGANGAYEVGVMKALFAGRSPATRNILLDPFIFTGTSAGSYNAAYLVSRWDVYGTSAITDLELAWLNEISSSPTKPENGIFRIRDCPVALLNPINFISNPLDPLLHFVNDSAALTWDSLQRAVNIVTPQPASILERLVGLFNFSSFISVDPMRQTIIDTIQFDAIRSSSKRLLIAATNWTKGQIRYFDNLDMTDQFGPQIILGSSALPGFFSEVAVGSQDYVDGGVLQNTPLNPAIDAGANVLHVISLFPDVESIPLANVSNTISTIYQQQVIAWVKTLQSSFRRVRDINRALGLVSLVSETVDTLKTRTAELNPDVALSLNAFEDYFEQYHDYTPLTVHHYFPRDDISGPLGLLDFQRERIEELIQRGFEDAVNHDCNENNCIMPSQSAPAEEPAG